MAKELGIGRNQVKEYESSRKVRKLVALAAERVLERETRKG